MKLWLAGVGGVACALGTAGCVSKQGEGAFSTGTIVLNKGVPLRTEHNMVLRIRKEDQGHPHNYAVVFGPYPAGSGPVEGMYINTVPTWQTSGGYTFALGWWPAIKTPRVSAAASGTTLIAWTDGTTDRIFMLSPSRRSTRVTVETLTTPPQTVIIDREGYVEATQVGTSITLSGVKSLPAATATGDPVRQFLDYVLGIADTAGVTE